MRIGVVAPARGLDAGIAARAVAVARAHFPLAELVIHPQCFLREGHFAGADDARAAAFVAMANDPAIDAIWFARGGYGANRLLAKVMNALDPAAAGAKTYLGYSDTGFLLAALYARGVGQVAHGPMVADLARSGGEAAFVRALGWLVDRRAESVEPSLDGRPTIALNLSIAVALVGTRWLPDVAGHVLMIEEVAEPLYRVDRMLFQLASAPALARLAGIRLGRMVDMLPNDPPWAENEPVAVMIERWCGALGVPWLGAADIGHDAGNRIVPFGTTDTGRR